MEYVRFSDKARILLKAGRGGEGSSARRKFQRHFVNWGGDGGEGGSVFVASDENIFDLSKLVNKKKLLASSGHPGEGCRRHGRSGDDLVIKVPIGTIVKDSSDATLHDITAQGHTVLIAKGGAGGKGNFKKKQTEPAQEGEQREVVFDFRIPADVVVLGATNIGKSTLLSRITNLKPRISPFPYTTILPLWGVAGKDYKMFTIMELPAIMGKKNESAPGIPFFKHLTRARIVVFLLDGLAGELDNQAARIRGVLDEHKIDYEDKYILMAVNKIDTIKNSIPRDYLQMDAQDNRGLDSFIDKILFLLDR